jgi:hypothetical protein
MPIPMCALIYFSKDQDVSAYGSSFVFVIFGSLTELIPKMLPIPPFTLKYHTLNITPSSNASPP